MTPRDLESMAYSWLDAHPDRASFWLVLEVFEAEDSRTELEALLWDLDGKESA